MLDKYQPSEVSNLLRFKLMFACSNRINRMDPFCLNLKSRLAMGDKYYAEARTIYGGFMEIVYNYGPGLIREPAVFTEPLSEEYCKQAFFLSQMINTTHPDLSLDLRSILKYRISADSEICLEYRYPVEIPSNEEALAQRMHALRYFAVPENISHPIYAVYNTTVELLKLNMTANFSGDFLSAGNEIYNIIINNRSQQHYLQYPIRAALINIPRVYVLMGTETLRLSYAQELYNLNNTVLNPLTALTVTARASESEVNTLVKGIPTNLNYVTMTLETFNTFETLPDQALHYIEELVSKGLSVNAALNYVSYASAAYLHNQVNMPEVFGSGNISLYQNALQLLAYCHPFNATRIVEFSKNTIFSTALQIPMRHCSELAETISHNYLHPHNLLSDEMHKRAHEIQEPTMVILNVMTLMMLMMLIAYISRKQLKNMKNYISSYPAAVESLTILERVPLLSPSANRTSASHSFFHIPNHEMRPLRKPRIPAAKLVTKNRSEKHWLPAIYTYVTGKSKAELSPSMLSGEADTTTIKIAACNSREPQQNNETRGMRRV